MKETGPMQDFELTRFQSCPLFLPLETSQPFKKTVMVKVNTGQVKFCLLG